MGEKSSLIYIFVCYIFAVVPFIDEKIIDTNSGESKYTNSAESKYTNSGESKYVYK